MSNSYSWNILRTHAVSATKAKESFLITSNIMEKDSPYALFIRQGCAFTLADAKKVTNVDAHDERPYKYSGNSDWLRIDDYNDEWLIVPKSIFNQTQTQTQPSNSENTTMSATTSNNTSRRIVRIELIDNDSGLDVQFSRVAVFNNIITEDDNATTIQEVIMNHAVAKKLAAHNLIREAQVNLDIQNRTGVTVNLLPVKLKQLTWVVKS